MYGNGLPPYSDARPVSTRMNSGCSAMIRLTSSVVNQRSTWLILAKSLILTAESVDEPYTGLIHQSCVNGELSP